MKKSIKTFITALGISMGIIGCASGPQPPQVKSINPPKKEVTINLNFPKKDPVTGKDLKIRSIDKYSIEQQIKKKMYSFSKYRKYSLIARKDNSLINNKLIKIDFGKVNIYKGIQVDISNNKYKIQYKNSHNKFTTLVEFEIPYNFNKKTIDIIYPRNYKYVPSNDWKGTEIPPLDNIQSLKQDIFNILNNLPKSKLYLSRGYTLQGEINTKYNPDSVYANFQRILGKNGDKWYVKSINTPTEKKDYFNLKIKDKIYPLEVRIYPYKNGSKVIYKASISYKIYSDGTYTLTKEDVENAKKEIEKVIND